MCQRCVSPTRELLLETSPHCRMESVKKLLFFVNGSEVSMCYRVDFCVNKRVNKEYKLI